MHHRQRLMGLMINNLAEDCIEAGLFAELLTLYNCRTCTPNEPECRRSVYLRQRSVCAIRLNNALEGAEAFRVVIMPPSTTDDAG